MEAYGIRCPLCGAQPLETTAKVVWVRGFLLAYQISHRSVLGCVSCVRSELLKESGKSLLLGWFSISALFINPILILYNTGRAVFLRPKPEAVARRLAEQGWTPGV